MRIVVHGQQAFGKAVLEALLKRGDNVIAVYVAPEKPGQKADPLKEAALAANLGNLLDRAPGRTLKCAAVAYVPLAIALGGSAAGVAIAPAMGAAFALLPDDLSERLMLGDTGANVVGAVLGLGVVLGTGETTRLVALGVVVALTVLAEVSSFSRIIDATPPLRFLDRLGATAARRSAP